MCCPSPLPCGTQDSGIVRDLDGGGLRADLNEVLLLHGVSDVNVALMILQNGMNERYSGKGAGSAFGEGAYLAGASPTDWRLLRCSLLRPECTHCMYAF